jgi:hypothetical protein
MSTHGYPRAEAARPEEPRQFGVGAQARIAAIRAADELRDRGIAAVAVFKPSMGGWTVQIHPGGIRSRE